jgi:hypothetical protein
MQVVNSDRISAWALKAFEVSLSQPYVSKLMNGLGFGARKTRGTAPARAEADLHTEIVDTLSRIRDTINDNYDLEEVLCEDEIMFWNSGIPNTSYGLRGGYASCDLHLALPLWPALDQRAVVQSEWCSRSDVGRTSYMRHSVLTPR